MLVSHKELPFSSSVLLSNGNKKVNQDLKKTPEKLGLTFMDEKHNPASVEEREAVLPQRAYFMAMQALHKQKQRFGNSSHYGPPSIYSGDIILGQHASDPALDKLDQWRKRIWDEATKPRPGLPKGWLDPFDTRFVVLNQINLIEAAARIGFLTKYPHWSYGQDFYHTYQPQKYNLSKLYELVINNDPSYAYLLNTNEEHEQAVVMAHVLGHVDFFKNNRLFQATNRQMTQQMGDNKRIIEKYIADPDIGFDAVEKFLDKAHSIRWLIDFAKDVPTPLQSKKSMSAPKINRPERDVVRILIDHGEGLKDWQRNILAMVRDESYYFVPQRKTKIMNEGWASFWHSKLMRETPSLLEPQHFVGINDMIAGVFRPQKDNINPYLLGYAIFRDIYERWSKGQHDGNPEYRKLHGLQARRQYNNYAGEAEGIKKIQEVRRLDSDADFIRKYFTQDVANRLQMYNFDGSQWNSKKTISSKDAEDIKKRLLDQLENSGQPVIEVIDANFNDNKELLLKHFNNYALKQDYAETTLTYIQSMWGNKVHLDTKITNNREVKLPVRLTIEKNNEKQPDGSFKTGSKITRFLLNSNGNIEYEVDAKGNRVFTPEELAEIRKKEEERKKEFAYYDSY